ncbi:MAG: hypothetical protein EXR62_04725 [Chloroflexi bacterium]|nr:hypothetical protein [Chloroflexota bacterium]
MLTPSTTPDEIYQMDSRRELFVDDWLIVAREGAVTLRLHEPIAREVALVTDRPWEGNMAGYITVFQDGERYRMYYQTGRFNEVPGGPQPIDVMICLAESRDGLRWERPDLELFEYQGSRRNNIVVMGEGEQRIGSIAFVPFKDTRPGVDPQALYKAVATGRAFRRVGGKLRSELYALISPDGVHWSLLQPAPIMTEGAFDSQNLVFWDPLRGAYRAYFRDFQEGRRRILTATSPDFVHWSAPAWLDYPGAADHELYTNQVLPYYRAPHLLVGFPTRYIDRPSSPAIDALPEREHRKLRGQHHPRYGAALTDGLFMSSRDGQRFHLWDEAFIRPGPQLLQNWTYGDNYQCWGLWESPSERSGAPPELSFISTENSWRDTYTVFRRFSLRIDGFVSLQAPYKGGEVLTRPLTFAPPTSGSEATSGSGCRLHLNFATSAAGGVWVEVQDGAGQPIPGFSRADCYEVIGDELDRVVAWQGGSDLSALAGTPVRLKFILKDADLYAMRFG